MAYYEKVLTAGETVRAIGHLHWTIFTHALLFAVGAVVIFVLGMALVDDAQLRQGIFVLCLILLVVAALAAGTALLRRSGTEIVVTDRRVIYKRGLLSRYTVEMNISKIETVDVVQSLLGRLLGYGTLLIRGTGSGFEPLRRVSDPIGIRNAIVVG